MSPWKDENLRKYKKATGLRGVYITLIKHMPRKIMIGVSGVLQAYGRPFIVKIRSKMNESIRSFFSPENTIYQKYGG